jgi:uncharacterized protein (TIGR02145 family)
MADNLKTTKYNDGTPIQTGWYCWYNNEEGKCRPDYGTFYNGYAVETNKLCPSGWHVPTMKEWRTLVNYLGGPDVAGGKLKEEGWAHWMLPNAGPANRSGFDALPGGSHYNIIRWQLSNSSWIECKPYEPFNDFGEYSEWWTVTPDKYVLGALTILGLNSRSECVFGLDYPGKCFHGLDYTGILVGREKYNGCYVRCIKGSSP